MSRSPQGAMAPSLRHGIALVVLFNLALLCWILAKPIDQTVTTIGDDVAQAAGPLLATLLCWRGISAPWRRNGTLQQWVPVLLGLGSLSFAIGQTIWTFYEQVLHLKPFPSPADAAFLAAYPFLALGILLLPTRPRPSSARARVLMDGLITMTALVTFSWYFVLGPTLNQGYDSQLGKVIGTAYPLSDLVLLCCLLMLAAKGGVGRLRVAILLLSAALLTIIVTDTIFDLQNLQETYATGTVLDIGWPLGYMLLALAGRSVAPSNAEVDGSVQSRDRRYDEGPSAILAFLPYALLPAVALLLLYIWRTPGMPLLRDGVYAGSVALVVLVSIRQVFAILENRSLYHQMQLTYRQLDEAYRALEISNEQTIVQARHTQHLNDELQAIQSELELNNEALVEANARLEALATTDPLTALPNHRALVGSLDQELERTWRYNRPCTIIFMDIDHFKAINDGYGHPTGDAILHEFAAVVRAALRGIDLLGRWGGEEFVAIMPETEIEGAVAVAERVRGAVAAHVFSAGGGIRLTCSLGLAAYPTDAGDRDALIDAADRAMYAAKRLGRNQVRVAGDAAVAVLVGNGHTETTRDDEALVGTVEALAALVGARDHYTGEHTFEVADTTRRLALALGLSADEARLIGLAGHLHDVGKIGVPDAVLQKTARLTDDEWAIMRTHPAVGADVVGRVPALRVLAPLIRGHHERWDGRGYPDGLANDAIPLGARIVAIADAFGAMTTDRPYRQACSAEQALAELHRCAGTQFDPVIVQAFEKLLASDRGAVA